MMIVVVVHKIMNEHNGPEREEQDNDEKANKVVRC